jgi:hypothetical protein
MDHNSNKKQETLSQESLSQESLDLGTRVRTKTKNFNPGHGPGKASYGTVELSTQPQTPNRKKKAGDKEATPSKKSKKDGSKLALSPQSAVDVPYGPAGGAGGAADRLSPSLPSLRFKSAQELELEQKKLELERMQGELEETRKLQEEQRQKQEQELQELRKQQEEHLMKQEQEQQEKLQQQQKELDEQRKQLDILRKEQHKELQAARQVQEEKLKAKELRLKEEDRQIKEQQKALYELQEGMEKEARDLQKRQVEFRQLRVVHGGQGGSATAYAGKGKEDVDAGRGKGKEAATGSGGATATYTQKERNELVQKFVDGIDAAMSAKEEAKAKQASEKKDTSAVDKARTKKKNPLDSEWRQTPHGQKKRDEGRAETRKKNLSVGRDCELMKEIFDKLSDDEKAAQIVFWDGIWEQLEDDLQDMTIVKEELKDNGHKYR